MDALTHVLAQLGGEPRAVANTLDRAGVTGRRRSYSNCPVANYIRMFFPAAFDVMVSSEQATIWEGCESGPFLAAKIDCPPAVRDFVRAFDEGSYPAVEDLRVAASEEMHVSVPVSEAQPAPPLPLVRI